MELRRQRAGLRETLAMLDSMLETAPSASHSMTASFATSA